MTLTVSQRGDTVATLRWIEVRLMETLAAWVPTTPEMEAKLVFGTHIWDSAQHADALGKRALELRLPEHDSLAPAPEYVALLDELLATPETAKRVSGFYDVVLPGLERRIRAYLDEVDHVLDGPTVRILERVLFDLERIYKEAKGLQADVPAAALGDEAWADALRQRELAVDQLVVYRGAEPAGTPAGS